jgi:TPR repeat protein
VEEDASQDPPSRSARLKSVLAGVVIGGVVLTLVAAVVLFWIPQHPITAKGQYDLGMKYESGDGVQKDSTLAFGLISKAAEQGYVDAQDNLGHRYENGDGVPKDDAQAVNWYEKAAAQGSEGAKENLAAIQSSRAPDAQQVRDPGVKQPVSADNAGGASNNPIYSDQQIDVQRLDKKSYYGGGCILTARIHNKGSYALNTVIIHVNGYDSSGTLTENATFVFNDVPAFGDAMKDMTGALGTMPATVKIVDVSYQ